MPIGDYPILEVIVRQLAASGFEDVVLAVNHQADIIKAFFADGSRWNVKIRYSLETKPLRTVAPLRIIEDLPENFLLMNGDILTDLNFGDFLERHIRTGRLFTISAACLSMVIDYGVLETDGSDKLIGFHEKPRLEHLVSMGVYGVSRRVVDSIPPDRQYGFDDLMCDFLARGETVDVVPYAGYWLDIGRADDYMQAVEDFDGMRSRLFR
jgi:NDP-sugar pyrophosphorylase family protein